VTHLLAIALGILLGYLAFGRGMALREIRPLNDHHEQAKAQGAKFDHERDEWRLVGDEASRAGDSLRAYRGKLRKTILAYPDSSAQGLGLHVTKRDSLRCLPLSEFADLVAAKVELEMADSAALRDSVALNACENAAAYSDSSAQVARDDAEVQNKGAQSLAKEIHTLRRTRWFYAAGGAAVALLVMIGANAL
jgi:hypothetical protein